MLNLRKIALDADNLDEFIIVSFYLKRNHNRYLINI
jgi:hypothetical protein